LFELIYIMVSSCRGYCQEKRKALLHEEISKYFVAKSSKVSDDKDDHFKEANKAESLKEVLSSASKLEVQETHREEEFLNGAYRHPFEYVTPRLYIEVGSELET
jgi:hypothetical protein